MKRIRSRLERHKTQTFVHMATYRFHEVFPGGSAGRSSEDLMNCVLSAVKETCLRHGWRMLACDVFPDRVEVLLTGRENRGENGDAVAEALDTGVHGATAGQAAAN